MSLRVLDGGVLSLLQDSGRRGHYRLGLSDGGPLDAEAFHYCNRLLGNAAGSTAIEIAVGGLQLEARVDTWCCLTGADMPLSIDGIACEPWTAQPLKAGQTLRVGFARRGCRAYLGVADGFDIAPLFGSSATVLREGIGGLRGEALAAGDELPCPGVARRRRLTLPPDQRPRYPGQVTLRVVPGYQQRHFSREEQRRFFGGPYTVTSHSDRMGYRLQGHAIHCDIAGILSEGIACGAIQIPPDGQPIVLLNDRQTIGGYPKIGTALAVDLWRLAQLRPGDGVHFAAITPHTAQRALQLAQRFLLERPLSELPA